MGQLILLNDETALRAAKVLSTNDEHLRPIIAYCGPCPIRPHTDYYRELVESIIGQQLSVKAAASIRGKFLGLYGGEFPRPQQLLDTSVDDLRSVGFSRAKAVYVHDLARHVIDGRINFKDFNSLGNNEIIKELIAVKGIGEWTAHMFLMWCMGRSDILPHGNLGIRNGIQKLYGLDTLPDRTAVEAIAAQNSWHPYESVASWYIWQSLDNAPAAPPPAARPV